MNGELDGSVRGVWKITDKGKARLEQEWSSWKPAYREVLLAGVITGTVRVKVESQDEENPQEVLEDALDKLNENLETEILTILSNIEPSLFESIIGQLLERMRYGNPVVTGRAGDGGIDGTCSLDALGLVKLHFQAKRWKNQVGAREIRDFIGGIQTSRGEYGIFVTTSEFTKDAIETAKKSGKVKLVDGHEMAKLMIDHGLGVTKTRVHVAKIDRDYFEGL
jgi:restriction system protein